MSVELALAAPKGRVYAVECEPDACELIRKNRAKFHACNLILIEGRAPDVLADLPAPDAVFIGGTKGGMEAVLDEVLGKIRTHASAFRPLRWKRWALPLPPSRPGA